jgi:hypothetical protein
MFGLGAIGPQELAGETSRMIVPSGFRFFRGLPSLVVGELGEADYSHDHTYLMEGE